MFFVTVSSKKPREQKEEVKQARKPSEWDGLFFALLKKANKNLTIYDNHDGRVSKGCYSAWNEYLVKYVWQLNHFDERFELLILFIDAFPIILVLLLLALFYVKNILSVCKRIKVRSCGRVGVIFVSKWSTDSKRELKRRVSCFRCEMIVIFLVGSSFHVYKMKNLIRKVKRSASCFRCKCDTFVKHLS